MKKELTVGLCMILLFFAILIFGYFFMINSTVMNPDYLIDRIDKIETLELIDGFIEEQESPEAEEALLKVKVLIPDLEPAIKEEMSVVIYSFYDYLKGNKEKPEIRETLGQAFLNPEFVDKLLAEISLPELIDVMVTSQTDGNDLPEEFIDVVRSVVADLEPDIKEQASEISGPVFDYILGVTQDINLKVILRDTILNEDFVIQLIERLDIAVLAEEVISQQLIGRIPTEMDFLTGYIDDAIRILEPTLKTELTEAAGPILDYLLGYTTHISIEISTVDAANRIENDLRNEFLSSPPPEYANLTSGELNELFDEYVAERLSETLAETYEINGSVIGPEIPANIAAGIADVEKSLTDIRNELDRVETEMQAPLETSRKYVSYIQLIYTLLIIFIVLMMLSIILLLRDVRLICRRIGIMLLIYGLLEYITVLVGRYFLSIKILYPDGIPDTAVAMITDTMNSVIRPLEIFSLVLLGIGLIMTVVSIVYKREPREPDIGAEVIE